MAGKKNFFLVSVSTDEVRAALSEGGHLHVDRCPWMRGDAREEERRARLRHLSAPSGDVLLAPNLPLLGFW